jgi:hypothetical protein
MFQLKTLDMYRIGLYQYLAMYFIYFYEKKKKESRSERTIHYY